MKHHVWSLALVFLLTASAKADVVTVTEASEAMPVNADLFGINDFARSATTASGTIPWSSVLDDLGSNGMRYPTGEYANYWNSTVTGADKLYYAQTPPSSGWKVDSRKSIFGATAVSQDSLEPRVRYAITHQQTITFVCNMVTPGADYFYDQDTSDGGKTTTDKPPVRSAAYPDNTSNYRYTRNTAEPDLWWRHMKERAFRCVDMLNRAKAITVDSQGLTASQIKIELGNELYFGAPYNLEVFPPDFSLTSEWDDLIEELPFDGTTDEEAGKIKAAFDPVNSTSGSLSACLAPNKPCDYDINDVKNVTERLSPSNDYAYAAVYFADLIKQQSGLADVKVAITGSTYYYGGSVEKLRVFQWEPIQAKKVHELDTNSLITAITQHPYYARPSLWNEASSPIQNSWTGAGTYTMNGVNGMGTMARNVYRKFVTQEYGRPRCSLAEGSAPCVNLFDEIWQTEWGFDWKYAASVDEREKVDCEGSETYFHEYDNTWGKALATAFMASKALEQRKVTALGFFELGWMYSKINCPPLTTPPTTPTRGWPTSGDLDATGRVLQLWMEASRDASRRTPLVFDTNPLLTNSGASHWPASLYSDSSVAGYEDTQPLPGLYGWKFTKTLHGENTRNYVLLNLTGDETDIDLSSIAGDLTISAIKSNGSNTSAVVDDETPVTCDSPCDEYAMPAYSVAIITTDATNTNNDADTDGVDDGQDAFPSDPTESADADNDGAGNNADPDDDNDGFRDLDENGLATDALNPFHPVAALAGGILIHGIDWSQHPAGVAESKAWYPTDGSLIGTAPADPSVIDWGQTDQAYMSLDAAGVHAFLLGTMIMLPDGVSLSIGHHGSDTSGNYICVLTSTPEVWCGYGDAADPDDFNPGDGDGVAAEEISLNLPSAVAVGAGFACAIVYDSTDARDEVTCWDYYSGSNTVPTPSLLTGTEAIAIAAGHDHVCAITRLTSGGKPNGVQCWGDNTDGQLGPDTSPADDYVDGVDAPLRIDAGDNHTCVINGDYGDVTEVICWGDNTNDQIDPLPSMTQPVSITATGDQTCAVEAGPLLSQDALVCWPVIIDTDGDTTPDYLDTDDDGDTVADASDNCLLVDNTNQADTDVDGIGDACDL